MRIRFFLSASLPVLLAACAAPSPREPLRGHLSSESAPVIAPEKPPASEVRPPTPASSPLSPKAETYSVMVNNVPVHDLLFVLARDARLNLDIHPGISGTVTLNAIDQTLPQLLTRIARQIDMRIEQEGEISASCRIRHS